MDPVELSLGAEEEEEGPKGLLFTTVFVTLGARFVARLLNCSSSSIYPLRSMREGGVGPQRMRQQLAQMDPAEKGFLDGLDPALGFLEVKLPLISSLVV